MDDPPPENRPPRRTILHTLGGNAQTGLFILAILYTVYFTRGLLFPIVLALLLTYLLAPLVRALAKIRVPRMIGAALVLGASLAVAGILISRIATPAAGWVEKAPRSMGMIKAKVKPLQEPIAQVKAAGEEIENLAAAEEESAPRTVSVDDGTLLEDILMQTPAFLASVATTIILLFFMLAYEDSFLRNIIRMFPSMRQRHQAVKIVRDLSKEVSRYLLTVAAINTCLGIAIGLAMWGMGLPNPVLWGVLGGTLNFVPYLGAIAGTLCVAVAAILSYDQLAWAMAYPAVYYALTFIEGTFITPLILGRSFTLHPIVIVVGLLFWTWLWGIPGTLLTVPILVTLRIFTEHIRELRPLRIMLEREV